jgi:DMSO/TMAO reductase YedYZ molybdopterin-dependent catalytic subunit
LKKFFVLLSLLLTFSLFGCNVENSEIENTNETDGVSEATYNRYQENEIKEYQGARLDPAIGPRDNSIGGVQYVDINSYTLKITGLVEYPKTYSYSDVLDFEHYEKLITLYCVEGWDATVLWEGVKITDLIEGSHIKDGANTVIFKAVDGYTTSMPIGQIYSREMILAFKSNGIDLPPQMGYPFIVVAEDKLGYKWARWVNEIEVSDDNEYEGFWEDRGFDNEADVPEDRKDSD